MHWVRHHFKCEANIRPYARRPSAVPRSYRLNHAVGLDLVDLKGMDGDRRYWLNIVCWGTSFQQVLCIGKQRDAHSVWQVFSRGWARIFGMPECIVVDSGTEFQGYFGQMVSSYDTALFPTDARAPWQNGRTERSGKEWKRQFKLAQRKETPTTMAEWIALGELCCSDRDRYQNRSGYSPLQ